MKRLEGHWKDLGSHVTGREHILMADLADAQAVYAALALLPATEKDR